MFRIHGKTINNGSGKWHSFAPYSDQHHNSSSQMLARLIHLSNLLRNPFFVSSFLVVESKLFIEITGNSQPERIVENAFFVSFNAAETTYGIDYHHYKPFCCIHRGKDAVATEQLTCQRQWLIGPLPKNYRQCQMPAQCTHIKSI